MLPIYRRLALDALYDGAAAGRSGPIYASNNWVVDGTHSASGKPLLANDPHLAFGAPGFWYLARLKTPQHEIAGGTAAGVPLVVIGHNERIAWGFTTTTADVEDLFIEKLDPADPGRYLTPQGSAAVRVAARDDRRERRGAGRHHRSAQPGTARCCPTPCRPARPMPGYVLALAATFTIPRRPQRRGAVGAQPRRRLGELSRGTAELRRADAEHRLRRCRRHDRLYRAGAGADPPQAARAGCRRRAGPASYDWTGFIPFAALPSAVNPPSGHFVSANNKIVPDSYPYFLSRDWDLPNRAERIEALLAATPCRRRRRAPRSRPTRCR